MEKLKHYYEKYHMQVLYLFFGGITTIVSFSSYFIFKNGLNMSTWISTTLSWILAVLTAFITNKLYVFESKQFDLKTLLKEAIPFFIARAMSYFINLAIMLIGVDTMGIRDIFVMLFSNLIVLVFNYIASKMFIFRDRTTQ